MQFKSVTLQKYVSADNGGGMNVTVDRDVPSSWETFRVTCLLSCCFHFDRSLLRRYFVKVICIKNLKFYKKIICIFCCSCGEYHNQNFNSVPHKVNFLHVMLEAALSLQQQNRLQHQRHLKFSVTRKIGFTSR